MFGVRWPEKAGQAGRGDRIQRETAGKEGQEMRELLERSFEMLGRAEWHFAGLAYTESTSPPFKTGPAYDELLRIRYLLADIQNELKK